jgi:hypothetical protein
MPQLQPFQREGVGGAELFAHPEAETPAYHDARARELERRSRDASCAALADALRSVAARHRATALALSTAREPTARARRIAPRSPARLPASAERALMWRSA